MPTSTSILLGLVGSIVTIGLFLISVTFRMGEHSSRLRELERWRDDVRRDMHEISDLMGEIDRKLTAMGTLLEERTERRRVERT